MADPQTDYVLAYKGIRISETNITLDMSPKVAERLRAILLAQNAGLQAGFEPGDRELIRRLCDGIAGPLPTSSVSFR